MAVALSQTDQLQVSWIPRQTLSIDIFISDLIITISASVLASCSVYFHPPK